MPRLILLNGPPAIGKTTLARRYAVDHPGTLVLDIDVLRTMVAGWESDLVLAGQRIRTTALAAITAYLADGGDVLVPQLCGNPTEVARFEGAATAAGATFLHVVMATAADEVVRRFRARGDQHPWAAQVTTMVADAGGDDALRDWIARLDRLEAIRVPSTDLEQTYRALLVALGDGL